MSGYEIIESKKHSWSFHVTINKVGNVHVPSRPCSYLMSEYYLNNQEKIKKRSIDWNKNNTKRKAENGKKWYNNNTHITIARATKWNREHTEKRRKISAKHNKTHARKYKARRRSRGFVELNSKFLDSHAHHVDNEQVIYIPEKLHRSVSHNLKTGRGMQRINVLAFGYLFGGDANSKNN